MLPFIKKISILRSGKAATLTMSTQLDNDPLDRFRNENFHHVLPQYYKSLLAQFKKIHLSFFYFNLLFLSLIAIEFVSFFVSIPIVNESLLIASSLGAIFLTFFIYLILLFYNQAKKPEQIQYLLSQFISSCRLSFGSSDPSMHQHLAIADALMKLSQYLIDHEWKMIQFPFFQDGVSRFSAYFYWKDVFYFKQLVLQEAIQEHLKQIRLTPTDLEVHTSLASAYIALSQIYKISNDHPKEPFFKKKEQYFDTKFQRAAKLAIEEFQILSGYAPNDPWVHEQLATGYHELRLYEQEINEMEILLKLRPHDMEILYRLGGLYFQQGLNSKGLQVYEALKQANYKKAADLISSYGCTAEPNSELLT